MSASATCPPDTPISTSRSDQRRADPPGQSARVGGRREAALVDEPGREGRCKSRESPVAPGLRLARQPSELRPLTVCPEEDRVTRSNRTNGKIETATARFQWGRPHIKACAPSKGTINSPNPIASLPATRLAL